MFSESFTSKLARMNAPSFSLEGQVTVVTGASRGIGEGLARALAEAGARVVLMARTLDSIEGLARELAGLAVPLDVTRVSDIQRAFAVVEQKFGRLDVLVNNAGIGENQPALEVSEEKWDELMAVNLKGLFFCCQAAARIMVTQKRGRIVNLSSQASLVGIRDHAAYCASKGGVNQLTRVLALEWAEHGVTVNAVAPTFILTPGTRERLERPEYLKGVLERIPLGRVGSIADVAGAVIYLASAAGGLVTGSVLSVDGGWTAQ